MGLLQFAYRDNEKHKHVLLIRLCKQRKIPGGFLALFRDNSITLVGNNIQGDLTNLQKDFPEITNVLKGRGKRNIINIGLAARRRDVVQSGVVGLQLLVKRTLSLYLPKRDKDIFSNWNSNVLTAEQIAYASKDALAHLEVYEALMKKPDLNLRIEKNNVVIGSKVDIVPRSGAYRNISCMATRAATGVIVDLTDVASPFGIKPIRYKTGKTNVAVEIETILSPSFFVPRYEVTATTSFGHL